MKFKSIIWMRLWTWSGTTGTGRGA